MQIDLRVLELLTSKVCHDLVSPVSAINNGVELIEDIGDSVADEAMKLIADSASHAARRLRLFRLAYGRAGSEENLAIKDVRLVVQQYISGGKITLDWPESVPDERFAGYRGGLKTLINLLILSEEILAYGGAITLHRFEESGRLGCRIEISGRNAQLSPVFQAAMEGTTAIEELTPRSIQPYITGRFAAYFDLHIHSCAPGPDRLDFILSVTPEYDENRTA
jgi:histidine phosphotransferase ChpT